MKLQTIWVVSAVGLAALAACKQIGTSEMKNKELEMLRNAKPEIFEADGKTQESFYQTSRQPLLDWVLSDTATLSYPFTLSRQKDYVTVATSADNRLRIYSWDTAEGGTMILWGNIIQYRSGDSIKVFKESLDMHLHPDGIHDEIDFGSSIDSIYTFTRSDGSMLYLAEDYFKFSSNHSTSSLYAMEIKGGKLVPVPCFVRNCERRDVIGFEHTASDWYFIANMGEGWDWLYQYNIEEQNLYVATTDEMDCITDRYNIYHFDGQDFVYQKTDGPFWLYPDLRSYQRLELLFETEDYTIRIDNLGNDIMRYASWGNGKTMSDKPDLILKGQFIEDDRTFRFANGAFCYIVYTADYNMLLEVQQDGKSILKQHQKQKEY